MKSWLFLVISALFPLTGCTLLPQSQTSAQTQETPSFENRTNNVDVETANLGSLTREIAYVGTTAPLQQVSVRSQVEGRLLNLAVDTGDFVPKGTVLAELEDNLLAVAVNREQAELAALESELARAEIQVKNAQIRLEEAIVQLEQAESDATRYVELAKTGLIAQQQAESYQTAAKVAQKAVLSSREQVNTEKQGVAAARGRIAAQKAVIAEQQQRQAFTTLTAPIDGVILTTTEEPGNLIQPGEEILQIGDFSRVKVIVPLSELDLGSISLGQTAEVKLDAFMNDSFVGKITSIAPLADANARQLSVEVTVPNIERKIKGGLLARVTFDSSKQPRVIVPESAIIEENSANYIFIVDEITTDRQTTVTKQPVELGDRANGKVEIITGIKPETKFVVRSNRPLQDRETVNLSAISAL